MLLDTNVMQSRTAANLVEFINKQTDLINVLMNDISESSDNGELTINLADNIIAAHRDISHRTEMINAKQESALDFMKENKKGGRPEGRRSNGRIKF